MQKLVKILWGLLITCMLTTPLWAVTRTKGGTLKVHLGQYPRSLNPYTGGDAYGALVGTFTMESLIDTKNEDKTEIPRIAKSWKVAKDKKTYTFYLNKNARFFDDKPITAEDVKFTFDTVYDKKCILCQSVRDYLGQLEYVKVVNPHEIEIRIKTIHFNNLQKIGGMSILPKHLYGVKGKDFNKDFDKVIYGSGPYVFQESKDKKKIMLVRNKNWWGHQNNNLPYYKDYYNFDRIQLRIIKEESVAFEMFKKKQLDMIYINSELYNKWDNKRAFPWKDKRCVRLEEPLYYPGSWRGISLNMRKAPTNEKNFRQALQYLLNRKMIIKKVFKNKRRPLGGPFLKGSSYSANLKPVPFNPKKAMKLLQEIGYNKVDKDGVLYKEVTEDGKKKKIRASIEVMHAWEGHNKWATIFKEDAKKAGVEIRIKLVEWTMAMKLMDEFKFDGFVIGWVGDVVPAPEQTFAGSTANQKGTSNYPGLNVKEINQLIADGPSEFDAEKRHKLYQKLETLIVDQQPYVFTYTNKSHMLAYWSHRVDPTEKPYLHYTGNDIRNPPYARWFSKEK